MAVIKHGKARERWVDNRLESLSNQVDFLVGILKSQGIALPHPGTSVLPPGEQAPNPVPPPILLIPSTPANTQEAETYGARPLQPPSSDSIPPIDKESVAEGNVDRENEMVRKVPVNTKEADCVGERSDIGLGAVAGNPGEIDEAAPASVPGSCDEAGKADDVEMASEAGQAPEPVSPALAPALPAEATPSPPADEPASQPPPPPGSQSTLQLPAHLPSLSSSLSPSPTPAPSLPGPQLPPFPSQTSRRSPRLQNPTIASPTKGKRPRADDEGRETSKRKRG